MSTLGGVIRSISGMASALGGGCLPVNRRLFPGGSGAPGAAMSERSLELEEEASEGLLKNSGCWELLFICVLYSTQRK